MWGLIHMIFFISIKPLWTTIVLIVLTNSSIPPSFVSWALLLFLLSKLHLFFYLFFLEYLLYSNFFC